MKVYLIEFSSEVEYQIYYRKYSTAFTCKKLAEMVAEGEKKANESYEIIELNLDNNVL